MGGGGGGILRTYNVPEDCNMIGCFQELRYVDLQEPIDPGAPCRGFLKGIIF